jgi:hypothetical protein
MKKTISAFLVLCLSVVFISCQAWSPAGKPAPITSRQCLPSFPDQNGWYGGDGAYSICLDEKRTLWLFGDTFASPQAGRKDRIGMDVILGTTLAVSVCLLDGTFSIEYFLKKKGEKFVSSFDADEWLWPQDPFIAGGVLYIPLLSVQALTGNPAPFNFRVAGHKIARISDFSARDPHLWPVEYLDWTDFIAPEIEALAPASIVHGGYAYFFSLLRHGTDGAGGRGNILTRISINAMNQPDGRFEYLGRDGRWNKKLIPGDARIIFPDGVSELSVRYHAEDGLWLAVYLSPAGRGEKLLFSTSKTLEGPWSAPVPFDKTIGEVDPGSPLYDADTFCYAGKEHQQFSSGRDLVVTYVCNSVGAPDHPQSFLRQNLFLYRPQVLIIRH